MMEIIRKLDRSLTFTPFIDPTLWMQKHQDGELSLNIATAFQQLETTIEKIFEQVRKTTEEKENGDL